MNNYFYGNETIQDYSNIEDAIRDLKRYIEEDDTYNQYINGTRKEFDDADKYCINHILAIIKMLEEYKKIKKEMEKISK